ncbi:MAG TPA: hypothetical protein VHT24_06635, partial [Pseudacidobacterium sp.]|nr:hypothetical protein [Pseudacidobacterium sp.]
MGETERGGRAGVLETVALENSFLRVNLLPSLGGKIASIQLKPGGDELLQQPLLPYASRSQYMRFDASDASGWDECLPSVAACEMKTPSGIARIPDHGDFWQVEWQVVSKGKQSASLSADGFSLPLRFGKALQLEEDTLRISYSLENTGVRPVAYIWSTHPLFAVDAEDRILLPDSVKEVTVEGSAGNRLGLAGTKQSWPRATPNSGTSYDLSIVGKPDDGIGDKLFAAAPPEGWCAIERRRLGCRVEFQFDPRILTHLGLWI